MRKLQRALVLHRKLQGKLTVCSKIPIKEKRVLSLVYTPGVAEAVRAIKMDINEIDNLSIKRNTIAVITDGSAVLGLGNVGPQAALPVMEGKCAIFAEFADIDAFPICLKSQKADEIIGTVINISPVFGGINLEDISAPRCFEIENKLQKALDIPVIHDDQHATAMVVLAGLLNATKIVNKDLITCKTVIVGAGAAGSAIAKLLSYLKIRNILILDHQGIISKNRKNLPAYKKELACLTNPASIDGDLPKAAKEADILIGVSKKGLFTKCVIRLLNKTPIVFALANPDPEITASCAKKWGAAVYANGRSDCSNQINNALVFPGFFKGLLKGKITKITNPMKVNAARALAGLITKPASQKFISSIFDARVVPTIAESINQ